MSASDDGAVIESWQLVESVPCRLDRIYTPTKRYTGGMIAVGTGTLFVKTGTDIQDGDRVILAAKTYQVNDVVPIEGLIDTHHLEVSVQLIDWVS